MRSGLLGQTVVVIGGSAGIGPETVRCACAVGARLIITARNALPLAHVAREIGAHRTAAFDAHDPASLQAFFRDLPEQIDHVMVTAGAPVYRPTLKTPLHEARQDLTSHLVLALNVHWPCTSRSTRP